MNDQRRALGLDHVLLAVEDLDEAARLLEDRFGLFSVAGGRHPDWGTSNRIIPVGDAYLELVTVVDAERADRSVFGRWVASARDGIVRPLGWAVRTTSIDDLAERLDLAVESGSRTTPDGRLLTWRVVGVERSAAEPSLPFFIEWGRDTPHPSGVPVTHGVGRVQIGRVELVGSDDRLADWLDDHTLPVVIRPGRSAVEGIVLTCSIGDLVIDASVR